MKLILASASRDRRRLMSWLGLPFEAIPSDFDETSVTTDDPEELVAILSEEKAKKVAVSQTESLVIGSDTIIVVDGIILGKPKDKKDAIKMLKALSNKTHQVYTGVAVINTDTSASLVEVSESSVTFKELTDQEIKDYINTGEPLSRAGSYQLLGQARPFITSFEGSVTGITGLPMRLLVDMLEESGYPIDTNIEPIVIENTGFRD